MKENDWIQQMKKGNLITFETLMDQHSSRIELLAIQYGCTSEQAGKITEETFRTLLGRLNDFDGDERLGNHLYKIAIEKLTDAQLTESSNENMSSFEEDQQLHEKIILLEKNEKIAFILSRFHGLKETEISSILGLSKEAMQQRISKAYNNLAKQETKLEKRLQFLHKSYGRLSFSFNKENVFLVPVEEIETNIEPKRKLPKKVLLSWVVGIVALLAIITVPIVTGKEFRTASDEKYIEKLCTTYEEEGDKALIKAGLVAEDNRGGVSQQLSCGPGTEAELERLIGELKRQIASGEKINRKEADKRFEKIKGKFELPSDMAKRLVENPLSDSKEKSDKFINEFIDSISHLQNNYYMIMYNNEEFFEEKMVDGVIDIEEFLEEKDSYPEVIQKMIDGMLDQNFELISLREVAPIYLKYATNDFANEIRASLHEDVGGYLTWLQSEPIVPHLTPSISINESVDLLLEIETTLLKSDFETQAYRILFSTYNRLFNILMMGSEQNRIFDHNGKIHDEYRASWIKIASHGEELPSVYIMRKIVGEMEASNWTTSKIHSNYEDNMFYEDNMLKQAFERAKKGELHSYDLDELDSE